MATIIEEPTPHIARENHKLAAEHWMAAHPATMTLFEQFAIEMGRAGKRFGIGLIAERVRWECHLTRGSERFLINQNHRAYIARELLRRHPWLIAYMRCRKVRC